MDLGIRFLHHFALQESNSFCYLFILEIDCYKGVQNGDRIAAKLGASHGNDVGFALGHKLADVIAQKDTGETRSDHRLEPFDAYQ